MSRASSAIATALSILFSTSALADTCSNVLFADEGNTLVVLFHNSDHETAFTEIRKGVGSICKAKWVFGLGGYEASCPDGRHMVIQMIYKDKKPSGIQYGDKTLGLQCAR